MMPRTAAPRPYRTPRPRFDRRTALGLAALLGVGAPTLAGCSQLPGIPGLGDAGGAVVDLLARIDPGAVGDLERYEFIYTRPAPLADLLGIETGKPLEGRDQSMTQLPSMTFPPDLRAGAVPRGSDVLSGDYLFVPTSAVSVAGTLGAGMTLWTGGAEVLDPMAEDLEGAFIRDGDILRIDPEQLPPAAIRSNRIAPVGEDLVFTGAEDPTSLLDTGTPVTELFDRLQDLLNAAGIADPHIVAGASWPEGLPFEGRDGEAGRSLGWVYATEMTSPEESVTRGAILVDGDVEELEWNLRETADHPYTTEMHVVETEIDGDILAMTLGLGGDRTVEISDLVEHYDASLPVMGPGIVQDKT